MTLEWLGQAVPVAAVICPPGTARDPTGQFCLQIPAGIDPTTVPGYVPLPPPVVIVPAHPEEKKNSALIWAAGIIAAGIVAAVVLR